MQLTDQDILNFALNFEYLDVRPPSPAVYGAGPLRTSMNLSTPVDCGPDAGLVSC